MSLGVRTWGNDPHGSTAMLVGTYEHTGAVGEQLLSVLPRVVVVPADASDHQLLAVLADELVDDEPGQAAVLDRLLDVLLVSARAHLAGHRRQRVDLVVPGAQRPRRRSQRCGC